MRALALLKDSFRETIDRKSFIFMVVLAGLLILFCAGISFRPLDERGAMVSIIENFNLVSRTVSPGVAWSKRYEAVTFEVAEFRAAKPAYLLRLKASPAPEVHRLIRHWQGIRMGKCKEAADPVPEAEIPVDGDLQKRFLAARFRDSVMPDVEVDSAGDLAWDVIVQSPGRHVLAGAEEMRLFFGAVTWRPRLGGPVASGGRYVTSAEIMYIAQVILGEFMAGLVGLLVAVIVTAGSVPQMLQKGTLDLLLSRPLERWSLLVSKYLGGCLFVLLTATLIIGGCWLTLSLRTGHWNPYFPLTILTLTYFFAVLYSVSVLAGVITRSHAASAIVTIVTWIVCYGVGQTRIYLASPAGVGAPSGLTTTIRFLHLLLPKTSDLALLNQRIIAKGGLGEASSLFIPEWLPALPLGMIFFTSTLFAAAMMLLAGAKFSKTDY